MAGSDTAYRAVEVNTKVRRLAYISALISIVGRKDVNEDRVAEELTKWSLAHSKDLNTYINKQGAITSSIISAKRYIDFAYSAGLLVKTMATCRVAHQGLLLYELIDGNDQIERNPFCLCDSEKIFYMYHLLSIDADILLTVFDLVNKHALSPLKDLQFSFRDTYVERLKLKGAKMPDGPERQKVFERKAQAEFVWKRPERYAEHLVPTRLNWLLDLGMMDPKYFNKHIFSINNTGHQFESSLPFRYESYGYSDITIYWLKQSFFTQALLHFLTPRNSKHWTQIHQDNLLDLIKQELESAFKRFRMMGTQAIPLDITIQYICIRLAVHSGILIDNEELIHLLSGEVSGILGVEVRRLPRPNESYIMLASTIQIGK